MNYKNNLFKLVFESNFLLILVSNPETYKISDESTTKNDWHKCNCLNQELVTEEEICPICNGKIIR